MDTIDINNATKIYPSIWAMDYATHRQSLHPTN